MWRTKNCVSNSFVLLGFLNLMTACNARMQIQNTFLFANEWTHIKQLVIKKHSILHVYYIILLYICVCDLIICDIFFIIQLLISNSLCCIIISKFFITVTRPSHIKPNFKYHIMYDLGLFFYFFFAISQLLSYYAAM